MMRFNFKLFVCVLFYTIQSNGGVFLRSFNMTMQHEGGASFTQFHYDNDGGGTKYGIALKTLKMIAGKEGIKEYDLDNDKIITANDLRKLTFGKAKQIYKTYYWDILKLDNVKSELVCQNFYDFNVNGGFNLKQIQSLVGVEPDGKIGNKTISAINNFDECLLSSKVLKIRGQWLLVSMKKYRPQTWINCKNGWKNRLNSLVSNLNKNCNHEKLNYFSV